MGHESEPVELPSDKQEGGMNQLDTPTSKRLSRIRDAGGIFDLEEHLAALRADPRVKFGIDHSKPSADSSSSRRRKDHLDGMRPKVFPPREPRS